MKIGILYHLLCLLVVHSYQYPICDNVETNMWENVRTQPIGIDDNVSIMINRPETRWVWVTNMTRDQHEV